MGDETHRRCLLQEHSVLPLSVCAHSTDSTPSWAALVAAVWTSVGVWGAAAAAAADILWV